MYEGEFLDDKMHGKGVLYTIDEYKCENIWKNGIMKEDCKFIKLTLKEKY